MDLRKLLRTEGTVTTGVQKVFFGGAAYVARGGREWYNEWVTALERRG